MLFPKNNIVSDKLWLRKVAELPCLICRTNDGTVVGHHLKKGVPKKRKSGDNHTLPLCWNHHTGPEGVEIHGNETEWFKLHHIYNPIGIAELLYSNRNSPDTCNDIIMKRG